MSRDGAVRDGTAVLLHTSVLHALDRDEIDRLKPLLEPVILTQGQLLAGAGERVEDIWIPNGAIVSVIVRLDDGEAVEAGLVGAEGIVGLNVFLGGSVAPVTAIVQVPGEAFRCRLDALQPHLSEFPGLRRAALRYTSALLASTAQIAACNATHNLRQRMARWLLTAHDRAGRDRFRLTHEFIAAMINVRRAGVSQFASELRDAGAIAYTRGEVRIVERAVLESEACECYGVIRRLLAHRAPDMVR
jgi:CRP-like cAMP-binding protein